MSEINATDPQTVTCLLCRGAVLYKAGDKLLYHPDQPAHSRLFVPTPAMFDLPFDNLFIPSRSVILKLHLSQSSELAFSETAPSFISSS